MRETTHISTRRGLPHEIFLKHETENQTPDENGVKHTDRIERCYKCGHDMIRLVRDTTKDSLEECGFDDLKDEIKDIWKALTGD